MGELFIIKKEIFFPSSFLILILIFKYQHIYLGIFIIHQFFFFNNWERKLG